MGVPSKSDKSLEGADDLVVMGRISAPYAVRGWVKIQPHTEYIDSMLDYQRWWVGREGAWTEFRLLDGKAHGQYLLAHLQGADDRDAAEALMGMDIAVSRADLPEAEEGEYYWDELVGLEVVNSEGVLLGPVTGLLQTGAHDVLQVGGERERLIPFVEAYIRKVDMETGCILVEWGQDWGLD
jgi:16S rRNA processing protein RimM